MSFEKCASLTKKLQVFGMPSRCHLIVGVTIVHNTL